MTDEEYAARATAILRVEADLQRMHEKARKTMARIDAFTRHMQLSFFVVWLCGVIAGGVLMKGLLQ